MPPNMVQVPKEEIKAGMPSDLIILRDKNGRQCILVPKCQRIALTATEHETMLHVKGTRVLHELSRSYFWPKMAEEIKALCNACILCKRASKQRQNLSSTFRQADHRVDNLDLPLLLEILFTGLPDEIRSLERFSVNTEKDTNVVTRIVQRWRSKTNPISNTVGGLERMDFLIAVPYADKLPIKVTEYIRQDAPFAVLIPLSLLNEIDRVGEARIDEIVRDKRSRMKLIISTSLGQAWLINHPSCRLGISTHSVFFTETPECEELQLAYNAIFSSWYAENLTTTQDAIFSSKVLPSNDLHQLVVSAIDRLMTGGMIQEHGAFADLTPRELRAQKRHSKRQRTDDQSGSLDVDTTAPPDQPTGRTHNSSDEMVSPFGQAPFQVGEVTTDPPTSTPTLEN
jgi:hypothetical protein